MSVIDGSVWLPVNWSVDVILHTGRVKDKLIK